MGGSSSGFQTPFLETSNLQNFLLITTLSLLLLKSLQLFFRKRSLHKKFGEREENIENIEKAYKSIPEPRRFPLIGNWLMIFQINKRDHLKKAIELGIKYGPYFRITLFNEEIIILNSPESVKALLMSGNIEHAHRGTLMEKLWHKEMEGMIIYPGGEKWKARRKLLNRPFTYKSLQLHNPCFHKHSERMVKQLEKRFQVGSGGEQVIGVVDDILKQSTFGISSETLMGADLEKLEEGSMFCENLDVLIECAFMRVLRPWLLIPWIWRRSSFFKKTSNAIQAMGKVTFNIIKKYEEKAQLAPSEDSDLSDTMIQVMLQNGVDPQLVFSEILITLGVGNETTPVSAEHALFMLATHQEHQERCREEVDSIFDNPLMSKNGILEFDALKEMKYLERCIQESLRIHPVAMSMRRLEAPLRINEELVLPKGVSVLVAPFILHNQPKYFPNPEKYDPDRFLPDQIRERHPYAYVPFSAGMRSCIGMKLAMLELKVILATILRNFEVHTPDKIEDVEFTVNSTIKTINPIRFSLTRRHRSSNTD
ncbi:unnamed protein product [Orchesella dallaii]|uniref:Cytochrome P450 4C1 n=1 Tax=Orchesella dallaii TaxID=48710 RepID=A0ABP1Q0V0_9HEXA